MHWAMTIQNEDEFIVQVVKEISNIQRNAAVDENKDIHLEISWKCVKNNSQVGMLTIKQY